LNPTENLWDILTANHWSNRTHGLYRQMLLEVVKVLNKTSADRDRSKTICADPCLSRAG